MDGTLFVAGGVLLVIGIIVTLIGIPNWKRRARIIKTPTSPISQAPGNGPVEIKGRIVPSEQGILTTPFSGRHAVWARIIVQEWRSRGRSSYWATLVNEVDGRSFFVDDASGQYARILPANANVVLPKNNVLGSGAFNDAPPHLEGFLQARGLKSTNFLGLNKRMRYEEQVLTPGDAVYALGPSRRDAGPPVSDGYRMVASSQLVLFGTPGNGPGELILTTKTEEELVSRMMWGFVGGLVASGAGALLLAAGGVVNLLDL